MLKMGIDYEFFITVDGKVARARNLTRYVDGNCSTAEYRTNVIKYVDDFQQDIRSGLSVVAKDVVSNVPLLTIPSINFLFTPVVKVPVYYSKLDFEIFIYKTAGIHFHRSDLPANSGRHAYISRIFNEISNEAAVDKPQILERIEAPVPGPSSGTIYRYANNGNIWRPKSGRDYYEFIAPPSSELLFNQEAIEAVFRLLLKGNIDKSDRDIIKQSISRDAKINLIDFLGDTKCDIYIFRLDRQHKIEEFPSSWESKDSITSWFGYINIVLIPETGDKRTREIEEHKFYSVWKKHTIGVKENDLTRAIKALQNKDFDWIYSNCLTRMDKVFNSKFFDHVCPPINFLSEVKNDPHYKPYYEQWKNLKIKDKELDLSTKTRELIKKVDRINKTRMKSTSNTTDKSPTYFFDGTNLKYYKLEEEQ